MKKDPILKKMPQGFWQYDPLPSQEELMEYYATKYYQEGRGSYEVVYSQDELNYLRLKSSLVLRQVRRLRGMDTGTVLDVGCGEGWIMDRFFQEGFKVRGVDFSSFGLAKFHPHLKEFFYQENIYTYLDKAMTSGERYDVLILANVIEHVLDPIGLLKRLKALLNPQGVLVIIAPNDFSILQEYLLANKIIPAPCWLFYPDHLSYFNADNMRVVLNDCGLKVEALVADNPIELNLINANSNYIFDPAKGKATHMYRVKGDNFLGSIDEEKLLDLYTAYASMGIGRNIYYFCGIAS